MRYFLHRTLCDVLEEMRDCWKTRNFAPLKGLIEEAQGMGNRMEAALAEISDLELLTEEYLAARKTLKKLNAEIKAAKDTKEKQCQE